MYGWTDRQTDGRKSRSVRGPLPVLPAVLAADHGQNAVRSLETAQSPSIGPRLAGIDFTVHGDFSTDRQTAAAAAAADDDDDGPTDRT